MQGWILYRKPHTHISEDVYEMNRFKEEAEKAGIDLEIFPPESVDIVVDTELQDKVYVNGKATAFPDFVIPRMGAGTTYFTLAVIRQLERNGVYSVNSSESIDTVKDKLFSQQILAQSNLPSPNVMVVKFPINVELVAERVGFPLVMKTLSGAQGKGVFLSETREHFMDMMRLLEQIAPTANIILQEYIKDSHGRDLRVVTVGGRVVACMERTAPAKTFKANFSQGGMVKDFPITPKIEWLAITVANIMKLDVSGVDLLFDGDNFKVCEVNSAPGFRGLESVCDVNLPQQIYHHVRMKTGFVRGGRVPRTKN